MHLEVINLLINYGAEVGLMDKLSRTPLYRSARLGYGAATKLLVDRGLVQMLYISIYYYPDRGYPKKK